MGITKTNYSVKLSLENNIQPHTILDYLYGLNEGYACMQQF